MENVIYINVPLIFIGCLIVLLCLFVTLPY